jgi:hypothetical protein
MTMLTRRRAILAGGVCAAVLLLTPARASAQSITTDFDKKANFAIYKTYSVSRGQIPPGASPLVVQRVEAAIDSEMSALGLLKVPTGGELSVVYHGATKEDVSLSTMNYGPRWGGGTVNVDRILIGMLMVDVIDAQGKNLLWRATASDTLSDNPQKNEKKIHKAVEKMFEKYPTAGK